MITFVIGSDVTKFRKSVTEIKQSCLMIAGFPLFFDLLFFATHLQTSNICTPQGPAARFRAVMLVIGFGLRGLALPKNSRPKSWQTTKFTINFHPLEHATRLEWIIFQDPIPYLLTVGNHGLVRVPYLKKTGFRHFVTFCRNPLHYGMDLALVLSVLALLTSQVQSVYIIVKFATFALIFVQLKPRRRNTRKRGRNSKTATVMPRLIRWLDGKLVPLLP